MAPLERLLLWVLAGLVLGSLVYYVFMAPLAQKTVTVPENPGAVPVPNQSTTPSGNTGTAPSQNASAPLMPAQNTSTNKSDIYITLIHAPDCPECQAGDNFLNSSQGVFAQSATIQIANTTILESADPGAQALISQYNITELPAIIISGHPSDDPDLIQAWQSQVGSLEADGSLVSRTLPPPYYDLTQNKVRGIVNGIAIQASNCGGCANASVFFETLSGPNLGMVFSNTTVLDENDSAAQALIKKYNITELPTLLLDKEASAYSFFQTGLSSEGTNESDGWFVLRQVPAPFVDLAANHTIRGLVDAIYVVNSSCSTCMSPWISGA